MKNRLEEIRKEKKVRQGELAKAMEVSRQTISSLENGRYSPSITLAFKLASYFDKTIEEIFIFEDESLEGVSNYLNYKGYVGSIKRNPDDSTYYGSVTGINTSVTFQGNNVVSITESFHNAVDKYLDYCALNKKEPEKSFRGSFNVSIDPELHRKIALDASKKGITLNEYIAELIRAI